MTDPEFADSIGRRIDISTAVAYLDKMPARNGTPRALGAAGGSDGLAECAGSAFTVHEGMVGKNATYCILNADVREGLRSLPSESVHCAVTSPPYFWQRDYGVEGQMGHEATIEEYVQKLADAFKELKRVLRGDGVFFLNIGDAYYNAKGRPHGKDKKHSARQFARAKLRAVDGPGLGLPRKSLIGLPWRVALAMQATGWTLRSDVIWKRPGCLGEPTAHDRPYRTYEHVFIFVKSMRYYFDRHVLGDDEDIWSIPARPENPYSHCAPFPMELVERCLACGCPQEGTVLDPFLGSGTTAIAALRSGRNVTGIELNASYCDLARQRICLEKGRLDIIGTGVSIPRLQILTDSIDALKAKSAPTSDRDPDPNAPTSPPGP